MDNVMIALALFGFICGFFSMYIANIKGHVGAGWLFLGFFFNIIALIAACGLPDLLVNQRLLKNEVKK